MNQRSCGNSMITFAAAMAMKINQMLDAESLNVLGAFFNVLGDQLSLLAALRQSEIKPDISPHVHTKDSSK